MSKFPSPFASSIHSLPKLLPMAGCSFADVFSWIQNLPPLSLWKTPSISVCMCSSASSQPSLHFSASKNLLSPVITFSIVADFNISISLWSSKAFNVNSKSMVLLSEENLSNLLVNFVEDVLRYASTKNGQSCLRFLNLEHMSNFKDVFNLAFLTLSFLVCIYEAPSDLRSVCLLTLKQHLTGCQSRQASKLLMKQLGSNLEEQWMRSANLAITNWIVELQATRHTLKTPSPLFSYAFSTLGLWKVQLYCPVIAMNVENLSSPLADERLQFSLNYHQLEGVLQFNYKIIKREKWVDVMVNIDNIRCDIVGLVSYILLSERGVGAAEKHFPSRISLQLTPIRQSNIISVSVNKSSDNPTREIGLEKSIEAGFDPPNPYLGLRVTAGETISLSLKPWKFEQTIHGYSANLNWFLHDSGDGKEVVSTRPSKMSLINPKAWYRDRYSSAYRPFTRQGGVVFAGDEYGESICWKIDKSAIRRAMEWEIKGWIWLTYWPNKYRTSYSETRKLEFREILHLTID